MPLGEKEEKLRKKPENPLTEIPVYGILIKLFPNSLAP